MASTRNGVSKDELLPTYEPRLQRDGDTSGSVTSFASKIGNNAAAAVLAYCLSSISMTLVNKYVVSGASWNLSFLYLAIQVCALIYFIISMTSTISFRHKKQDGP
jgi:GDP-mannose transporter